MATSCSRWRTSPQPIHPAPHDVGAPGGLARDVVGDNPLLESIGPPFVTTHAGANLGLPGGVLGRVGSGGRPLGERTLDRLQGLPVGGLAMAGLGLADDPGGDMGYAAGVLPFVAVLAATAGAGVPVNAECGRRVRTVPMIGSHGPVKYGNRDGRGMNPTAALSRRYALDTMASRLVIEAGEVVSFDDEDAVTALNFSANAIGQALVGAQEVGAEQLGVGAALGGPDFDDALHGTPRKLERAGRIELPYTAWKAGDQPMAHARRKVKLAES